MKIFELQWTSQGEKEWVAARNVIEAIKTYCSITDFDLVDFDNDDDIIEIPESEWSKYTIKSEDNPHEITFEEFMKDCKTPDIIAGTMYE